MVKVKSPVVGVKSALVGVESALVGVKSALVGVTEWRVEAGVEVVIFIYIEIVYQQLKSIKYNFFQLCMLKLIRVIQVTGQSLKHGKSRPLMTPILFSFYLRIMNFVC